MRRYLVYAIGEILLVVIGILLALQINSWNSNRIARKSEFQYLTRLSEDIKNDSFNYTWTSDVANEKLQTLERIIIIINAKNENPFDTLSLIYDVGSSKALTWDQPGIFTGTIEELRSSGNFSLIQKTDLRTKISKYYFQAKYFYDRIEKRRISPSYGTEIFKLFPEKKLEEDEVWNITPWRYREDLISKEEIITRLYEPDFKKLLIAEYNLMFFIHKHQNRRLEHARKLLAEIQKEME